MISADPKTYLGFREWVKVYTPMVDAAIRAAEAYVRVSIGDWHDDPCTVDINACDSLDSMRKIRKALGGGLWDKEYTEWNYTETRKFSDNLTVTLEAYRSSVCTRVKVGTKTVTKPDPKALDALRDSVKQITVEEPIYEWKCDN